MRRWLVIPLSFVVLTAITLVSSPPGLRAPIARAADVWDVQVGGDPEAGLTAIAYSPNTLTIHVGDAVRWTFPSLEPHTVTFDAGHQPPLFVEGFVPTEAGEFDITAAVLPRGTPGPNGAYDGSFQISSGVSLDPPDERTPFSLTFTQPGLFGYICAIHGPGMQGQVTVLPAGAPLPETPAQAIARGQATLAGNVAGVHGGLELGAAVGNNGDTPLPNGTTLHSQLAGLSNPAGVAALQFYPANHTIHRGDTVVWNVPDPNEIHTVTFLSGGAAPPVIDARPRPDGSLQFFFPAAVVQPSGGTVYRGTGVLSSGLLYGFAPGNSFAITFDAPAGTYEYVCLVHGDDFNMKGTITITE